jgi:phage N-6-adenine-methyltransferase
VSVHFSSNSVEWGTPQDVFDKLDAEFHFTLDPCATAENAKCKTFYTKSDDGLGKPWRGHRVFMNPPYGRVIGSWMRKAYQEYLVGACVVCLVPARTDTAWWHDFAMRGEIRFLRGRLKFSGNKRGAPFPSAVVIFRT